MLDPLFQTAQHKIDCESVVSLLREVKIKVDESHHILAEEKRNINDSEMNFREFIHLCKRAMHCNKREIKRLLRQLKGFLAAADGADQLPTDLTISIARRRYLIDTAMHQFNVQDEDARLKKAVDSAKVHGETSGAFRRASLKLQAYRMTRNENKRRSEAVLGAAQQDVLRKLKRAMPGELSSN
jgi:hypothetical protein